MHTFTFTASLLSLFLTSIYYPNFIIGAVDLYLREIVPDETNILEGDT